MTARGRRRRIGRRTVNSPATLEAYLRAGSMPRFIERALEIESGMRRHRVRLGRQYAWMREKHMDDPEGFAARWRATAKRWPLDDVNTLIEQHNEWYPVERQLPMSPRTRDYVVAGGRDWRRRPLDADWILERFPPTI